MNTKPSGVFITATDTGVGKTTVTTALGLALQHMNVKVGVMKPVETGVTPDRVENSDVGRLRALVAPLQTTDQICLYSLTTPLAPLAASRKDGVRIDLARIVLHWKKLAGLHDFTLVEGVGGVMVPLSSTDTVLDLICHLHLPCIIVARTTLGAVNHVLLTIESLRSRGIKIIAIVLNESSPQSTLKQDQIQRESTIELINEWCDTPVIGPLSYDSDCEGNSGKGILRLALTPPIQELAKLLMKGIA